MSAAAENLCALTVFLMWTLVDLWLILAAQDNCSPVSTAMVLGWISVAHQFVTWAALMFKHAKFEKCSARCSTDRDRLTLAIGGQAWLLVGIGISVTGLTYINTSCVPEENTKLVSSFVIQLIVNTALYIIGMIYLPCFDKRSRDDDATQCEVSVISIGGGGEMPGPDTTTPALPRIGSSRIPSKSYSIENRYREPYEDSENRSGQLDSQVSALVSPRVPDAPAEPPSPSAPLPPAYDEPVSVIKPAIVVMSENNPPSPPRSAPYTSGERYHFNTHRVDARSRLQINIPGTVPPVSVLVG